MKRRGDIEANATTPEGNGGNRQRKCIHKREHRKKRKKLSKENKKIGSRTRNKKMKKRVRIR